MASWHEEPTVTLTASWLELVADAIDDIAEAATSGDEDEILAALRQINRVADQYREAVVG